MSLKMIILSLALSGAFFACSSGTPKSEVSQDEIKEIQTLDSLNNEIEGNILEIEENIQSVENAVNELDDFE